MLEDGNIIPWMIRQNKYMHIYLIILTSCSIQSIRPMHDEFTLIFTNVFNSIISEATT